MDLIVLMKQVPDVVEELVIDDDGKALDADEVMYIPNELDEHALEQALLLKERHGGKVTVISVGGDEAKEALASAVAKGADAAIYVEAEMEGQTDNHKLASHLDGIIRGRHFDLLLTGVQAVDDLDGSLGGLLATHLALPYVGGLAKVTADPGQQITLVEKEFPGGLLGELEVAFPAILGVQSAEQPPRYVPISKVMQTKKTLELEELAGELPDVSGLAIQEMVLPEPAERAEMLEGDGEAVAARIVQLLQERGLI